MKITKEQLIQLILIDRMSEREAAEVLGVHRNTVHRAKKLHEINPKDWWMHQKVYCVECGGELDPGVELSEKVRKKLIARDKPECKMCKDHKRKENNRLNQYDWRHKNRDKYNEYMRKWRANNKERWKKIKDKSRNKHDSQANKE